MKTVFSSLTMIASLVGSTALGAETNYPLTIDNCGHTLSFDAAPQTTVTIGQSTTEILYLLGQQDRIAGTSVWFSPVLSEFKDTNDAIERLADNDPSFESVLGKRPDLVTVMYEWHVGPEGMVGTRDSFHEVGVPTYVMPTDCAAKDNSVGADGTRSELFTTQQLYTSIEELARIYNAQEAGATLLADLQSREAKAVEKAKSLNLPQGTSALFWFSSSEMAADPYVAGQQGVPAYMMDKLGVENVVTSAEEWPLVGWETLAKSDPTFIVLAKMDRRRFPADDIEKKRAFLMNDPVAREMTAVKEGRIITMDAHAMDPTVRAIYALETMADALSGFDLAE